MEGKKYSNIDLLLLNTHFIARIVYIKGNIQENILLSFKYKRKNFKNFLRDDFLSKYNCTGVVFTKIALCNLS